MKNYLSANESNLKKNTLNTDVFCLTFRFFKPQIKVLRYITLQSHIEGIINVFNAQIIKQLKVDLHTISGHVRWRR